MTIPAEIQDLVDNPSEAPHVELKEWIDLSDGLVRAKTARHLAALANFGGGSFIIGIRDDLSLDPDSPKDHSQYSRDKFAGIVDKFLTPIFQCEVFLVTPSSGGLARVVVRVPSHGSVPVCAKGNGPADERGNIQGIRKGEHYIRVPGPKSVVVDTPELWQQLIHRCVLNDSQKLLESFGRILRPLETNTPEHNEAALREWHAGMRKRFEEML
jgi:predicted HTH transcriptional regulator